MPQTWSVDISSSSKQCIGLLLKGRWGFQDRFWIHACEFLGDTIFLDILSYPSVAADKIL